MTLKVSRSGVFKTVVDISVRRSGVWKVVKRILVYKTTGSPPVAGWREFYVKGAAPPPPTPPVTPPPTTPPVTLTVTLSASSVTAGGKYSDAFPVTRTTVPVTATASGGTGPYTYQWILMSWTGTPSPTINSPNGISSTFSKVFNDFGTYTATFKCKVTDSKGNKGEASVNVTFRVVEYIDTGGTL